MGIEGKWLPGGEGPAEVGIPWRMHAGLGQQGRLSKPGVGRVGEAVVSQQRL